MQEITFWGLPVLARVDGTGFYVEAVFQRFRILDSPLVVKLDPPVATVDHISYPELEAAVVEALRGGAVIL